ncbi:MAG TPA: fatty acid desaturase [Longimicrobiaceae bacterium]|nr:fatty acid desaturase [Longimicrobiaceae bacterium]
MHALSVLNREFAARGFHRKPTGRLLAQLAVLVAMSLAGTAAFALAPGWPAKCAGLLVMALANLGITTHTHSSSHNATSPRLWVNKALTFFGYGICFGTSSTWWWNKHIAVHHPTPNVIGLDDDVDLLPWFALTEEEFHSGGPLRRWYYRHQWLVLPLAVGLTAVNMVWSSWRFLLAALRDPRRRSALHWIDLGVLLAHLALWIALPLLWFSAGQVLGFYLLRGALLGYVVFATSAPAHFPAEARFLASEGHRDRGEYRRRSDYVLLQTVTTVNFRTGALGRFLCCGADHQLEHHLFPGISHVHYPRMSPVLRAFCEENGYPYRTLGWGEGVWKSLQVFRRPKPVEPALEAVRLRARAEEVPVLEG